MFILKMFIVKSLHRRPRNKHRAWRIVLASSVLMAFGRAGCPVTPRGVCFVLDGMIVLLKWVLK